MLNLHNPISTPPFKLLAHSHTMDRCAEDVIILHHVRSTQQGETMESGMCYLASGQHLRLFQLLHCIDFPCCFCSAESYLHCLFYQSGVLTATARLHILHCFFCNVNHVSSQIIRVFHSNVNRKMWSWGPGQHCSAGKNISQDRK
jgi:hypothetical protein